MGCKESDTTSNWTATWRENSHGNQNCQQSIPSNVQPQQQQRNTKYVMHQSGKMFKESENILPLTRNWSREQLPTPNKTENAQTFSRNCISVAVTARNSRCHCSGVYQPKFGNNVGIRQRGKEQKISNTLKEQGSCMKTCAPWFYWQNSENAQNSSTRCLYTECFHVSLKCEDEKGDYVSDSG